MARTRNTNKEITQHHEMRAFELRQQLWTHERIAKELGVERSTVTKMLKRINKRYSDKLEDEVKRIRAEHTLHLEHMADEAMQAWLASKQPAKDARRRKTVRRGEEEENRVQTQNADPRFLAEARAALADIRDIWGADAPSKLAPTDPTGEKEFGQDAGISDEQRAARIAALFDAARTRRAGPAAGDGQTPMEAAAGAADDGVSQSGG
jgi:DNA-binding MarR family transcriptional regulator